jgi:transcriptional regulator with XRE-family HTH domain
LTQHELASRASVSLRTIGNVEAGRSPGQATLKRLERAFRVPPGTLHQDPALRPVFFSAADRQIERFLGRTRKERQALFEWNLLINALFQPGIIIAVRFGS